MMSYWVLFIGIAVVSWLVQMNLQNKFKKYSKIPTGNGDSYRKRNDRTRCCFEDVA